MNSRNLRILRNAFLSLALAAPSAYASLVTSYLTIDFNGGFIMHDPTGTPITSPQGVTGSMTMNIPLLMPNGPYPGTAQMQSTVPFFGLDWTADGTITGYQNILGGGAPAYCGSHAMCADADMTFNWGVNAIPVDAAFGMDPNTFIDFGDFFNSIQTLWDGENVFWFDVSSLDVDGDGIPGTAMTQGPFIGFTPEFFGYATVTGVCVDVLGLLDVVIGQDCIAMPSSLQIPQYPMPQVPIPSAVWLFGSGLLGLLGVARRRQR